MTPKPTEPLICCFSYKVGDRYVAFNMVADDDTTKITKYKCVYESEIMYVTSKFAQPGDTVIDAGANIGWHTLSLASLVGLEGKVIAIEPDPNNLKRLYDNLKQNSFTNITVHEKMLWSADQEMPFYAIEDRDKGGWSGLIKYDDVQSKKILMHATTLDNLLPDVTPRFIKVDCEGAEEHILHGAENMLRRGVGCVVMEIHPFLMELVQSPLQRVREYMHSLGYEFFLLPQNAFFPMYVPVDVQIDLRNTLTNCMFSRFDELAKVWKHTEVGSPIQLVFREEEEDNTGKKPYTVLEQILKQEIFKKARRALGDWVFEQTSGSVQAGPFKGMKMLRGQAWQDGALSPMLLGTHEEELHGVIEKEIERLSKLEKPIITNIGCGEGYYAVGLARRLPNAIVYAIDTEDESVKLTEETAALNNVKLSLMQPFANEIHYFVDNRFNTVFEKPDLVVMDCEGAEAVYLDPELFPGLLKANILVEVHEETPSQTSNLLYQRWKDSHHITAYFEATRNPNVVEFLHDKPSFFRWLSVCENRPCRMHWFFMVPR